MCTESAPSVDLCISFQKDEDFIAAKDKKIILSFSMGDTQCDRIAVSLEGQEDVSCLFLV